MQNDNLRVWSEKQKKLMESVDFGGKRLRGAKDDRNLFFDPPIAVIEALQSFADDKRVAIGVLLETFRYDSLMGCYSFTHGGVFYGIELDGYVHS